jgi:hypothetical protein
VNVEEPVRFAMVASTEPSRDAWIAAERARVAIGSGVPPSKTCRCSPPT